MQRKIVNWSCVVGVGFTSIRPVENAVVYEEQSTRKEINERIDGTNERTNEPTNRQIHSRQV